MKRTLDILFSLLLIIVLLPLILFIMIMIYIKVGRPIFFKQKRPGYNKEIFSLIKFRTMNESKDEKGDLLPDNKRLIPFGATIRQLSLDELPQLFNVLKGDMSFVGPRPLLIKYLPYYTQEEKKRHLVRPGITGLAQVKGRNTLNWNDRLAYDVYYVENRNLLLDLKIIFLTIVKVFKKEDLVVDPRSIMQDLDQERGGEK